MHVAGFSCPSCGITLRVRDRRFLGRVIDCPDCRQSIRIVEGETGEIFGLLKGEPSADETAVRPPRWSPSPAQIGWSVAGCAALLLGLFLLRPISSDSPPSPSGETADVAQQVAGNGESDEGDSDSETADRDSPAGRLEFLHGTIESSAGEAGRFPSGTVAAGELAVADRLSWIAALIAAGDDAGPPPAWDRPWHDPANARFVRRQQPAWLNPRIDRLVSDDRYPATHFVGVAGVGEDAAALPANHPRAGIFGHDRRVSLDDVGDGLGNTMLVAGVESRLGSWAAGGKATVRGFTAEPFIGGPDGFGTGDEQGMHVLMADGSVRFVSRETDPVVIRRMAAMNDGLPLDRTVPGGLSEPSQEELALDDAPAGEQEVRGPGRGDRGPDDVPDDAEPLDVAGVIADLARPKEVPIDVLLAEPPVTYDVEGALAQKIVAFDQKDPVPVRDLLRLAEEMAAVPIRLEELPPEKRPLLKEPITLSLDASTVGKILAAVLKPVDLEFDPRPEGIFVVVPED